MLCSEEMQKRDNKNLPLSYYIFGAVNNSQLDAKSIGKNLEGAKPIWQRKKPSAVKDWAVISTIVVSQILHRLLEALFINLEATAPSEDLGGGGGGFKYPFKVHHIPLQNRGILKNLLPLTCKNVYLFIYSFIHSFIHSFIYLFIYLQIYQWQVSQTIGQIVLSRSIYPCATPIKNC